MLDPQVPQVDRVIRQKVLPSAAQRQAHPARPDPEHPAQPRKALTPHQMPFGVALSSQPLQENIPKSSRQIILKKITL
jgi:hypothetical protein